MGVRLQIFCVDVQHMIFTHTHKLTLGVHVTATMIKTTIAITYKTKTGKQNCFWDVGGCLKKNNDFLNIKNMYTVQILHVYIQTVKKIDESHQF